MELVFNGENERQKHIGAFTDISEGKEFIDDETMFVHICDFVKGEIIEHIKTLKDAEDINKIIEQVKDMDFTNLVESDRFKEDDSEITTNPVSEMMKVTYRLTTYTSSTCEGNKLTKINAFVRKYILTQYTTIEERMCEDTYEEPIRYILSLAFP